MDAPLYPPASHFEQPVRVARLLNTRDVAISILKANPAAWAIVLKEAPRIDDRINNPMLQVHLGNFAFRDLLQFGFVKAEVLDRIDVQLRTLGEVK